MARWIILLILATGLAGCTLFQPIEPSPSPRTRPSGLGENVVVPRATSEQSAALRAYLIEVQSSQLTQGLLRTDGGGPDTPYTATMLARNFERTAFFNEYGTVEERSSAVQLRRWIKPVRMEVIFGASVPPSQRETDINDVTTFAERLSRVTRHPVSVGKRPNFFVLFVGEDDRAEVIAALARRLPGLTDESLAPLRDIGDDVYCAVAAYSDGNNRSQYGTAVAVIRTENPDLLRLSCIHEELAQGLGLANDSPDARPSIFNDDDEFALLTRHDEQLLEMLYSTRLTPGMSLDAARPIINALAEEITASPTSKQAQLDTTSSNPR